MLNWEIAAVLLVLIVALVLFVTEWLRMDVVALLVLSVLAISGLVTVPEALAGFSNPAVITVWAMFILSAGLSATGVADAIGGWVLRIAGASEPRIILTIMMATGVLSAFMNNIGVAALMLPVTMDIARRTGTSPSRLLMPMAYASLLGGLTTLVGTPPNLVASDVLRQAGREPFSLFAFTPIGGPALVVGSLFVATVGRRLLPGHRPESHHAHERGAAGSGLRFSHHLEQRRFQLRIPEGSPFDGVPLRDTGLGSVLGLNVYSVSRGGGELAGIDGDFELRADDRLHVQGRIGDVRDIARWKAFEIVRGAEIRDLLALEHLVQVTAEVGMESELVGLTVREADVVGRFGAHILAVRRGDKAVRRTIADFRLAAGDRLQLELPRDALPALREGGLFAEVRPLAETQLGELFPEDHELLELDLPDDSPLAGATLASSGLADLELRIVGIARSSGSLLLPGGDVVLEVGDRLLAHGTRRSISRLRGLQSLQLLQTNGSAVGGGDGDGDAGPGEGDAAFLEATLSPDSALVGKTLRELDFRRRYRVQVLSIWRSDRAYRSHLGNIRLQFGDALLLSGERSHLEALVDDPGFLVLTRSFGGTAQRPAVRGRAWLAAGIMAAVVLAVLAGWLPVAVAAIAGGVAMVATRCLAMDDAYAAIDWRSVFLIACMMPLGTAMDASGAAAWLGHGVAAATGPLGPWGLLVGLYLLTALATTIVPTAALVVIMARVGMDAAAGFDIPPETVVMTIAMAASASFTSPISHPANVLVMGPGGYRFVDYVRLGLCLAVVVMVTVLPMIALRAG